MRINMRKYINDNLLIVDIVSERDNLKNILILSFTDDKKNIFLKKVFKDTYIFVDGVEYDIFQICKNIVDVYGDKSDIEKLWLAHMIYKELNYID